MTYPLVGDRAAEGLSVRLTCGVLGHSTQACYAWVKRAVSRRDLDAAYLTNALIDEHGDDPEFGHRLLSDELVRLGQGVGERRVWRLCSQQKQWSATVRKGRRGSGKTPGPAVHDDHVQRDFTAARPNAVSALRAAAARRSPTSVVIVHSNRGSQLRARSFRAVLTAAGLQGSMAGSPATGDNAAMEAFKSLLQKNVLDRRRWRTRDELHTAVVHRVEHTCNNRRRQRGLGKLTRVEFELASTGQAVTAA